jgi:hypothetical protein
VESKTRPSDTLELETSTVDPNRTYLDMLDMMRDDDHESARRAAIELRCWTRRGGFYPADRDPRRVDRTVAKVLARTRYLSVKGS